MWLNTEYSKDIWYLFSLSLVKVFPSAEATIRHCFPSSREITTEPPLSYIFLLIISEGIVLSKSIFPKVFISNTTSQSFSSGSSRPKFTSNSSSLLFTVGYEICKSSPTVLIFPRFLKKVSRNSFCSFGNKSYFDIGLSTGNSDLQFLQDSRLIYNSPLQTGQFSKSNSLI